MLENTLEWLSPLFFSQKRRWKGMALSLHVRQSCGGKGKKQHEMSRMPLAARAKEKKRVMDEVTTQTIAEIIVCTVTLMVAIHNCFMRDTLSIGLRRNRLPSRSFTLDFHNKRSHLRNLVYSNDNSCYNVLRMYKATFDHLCSMLDEIGGLKPTKHMLVDDQVAMCWNILAYHAKNRVIQWNFG
ncbi:protein ALP1-like [Senna tora]|uniref:Protein ALP1-like n=1 Tax=Senna tora TaxID=362788 RepID=A0A834TIT7_9FABA|nr:protein ALP1-like [Senna tora]